MIIIIDDKYNILNIVRCVNCYNYSTRHSFFFLAACINSCSYTCICFSAFFSWWLQLQSGPSYMCNPYVGVSCMQVWWELSTSHTTNCWCVCVCVCVYYLWRILLPVGLTSLKLIYLCILWTTDWRIAHTYRQFVFLPLKKGWCIQQ